MSLYDAYVKKSEIPIQERLEKVSDRVLPVDWAQVITDLKRAGVSLQRIADIVIVSRPTIDGWVGGSIPNYESGAKLLEVHAEATGKPTPVKKPSPVLQARPVPVLWPDAASR